MIDLGGFSITYGQRTQMVAVLLVYSVLIIGLGIWVKKINAGNKSNKFASYLVGDSSFNSFEIAMFTVTTALAGGTMVGGPGLSYGFGFVSILSVFAGFAMNLTILGTIGKKVAIVGRRIHALTPLQLLRHRFQSKTLTYILGLALIIFTTTASASNLMIAAKLFTAITGVSSYFIGLFIAIIAIIIYTMSGGIKSLGRICVVQGILMVIVVTLLCVREYSAVADKFGSIQAAMETVAIQNPTLVRADTWTPFYSFGLSLLYGWSCFASATAVQGNLVYNSTWKMARAIIIGVICTTVIHFAMTGSAVLTYALNPNLEQPDYSVVYLASSLLPGSVAGFAIAACFAAVQSTVAAQLLLIAAAVSKDIYKDCMKPDLSEEKLTRLNNVVLLLVSTIAVIIGLFPTTFTQFLNIFAGGGNTIAIMMPILFGLYWRNATASGAVASSLGGMVSYVCFYLLSVKMTDFWRNTLGNPHPLLMAMIVSFFLMIVVSKCTKKVPLGICEVWFGEDYDESFCNQYDCK